MRMMNLITFFTFTHTLFPVVATLHSWLQLFSCQPRTSTTVRTEFSPFICRVGVTSRCSSGVSTSPSSHAAVHAPLQRRISGVGVSIWSSRYFRFDSKGRTQLSCFQAQQPENSPATSCTVWEILQIIYVKITLRERASLKNTCSNASLSFLYLHFHNTKLKLILLQLIKVKLYMEFLLTISTLI